MQEVTRAQFHLHALRAHAMLPVTLGVRTEPTLIHGQGIVRRAVKISELFVLHIHRHIALAKTVNTTEISRRLAQAPQAVQVGLALQVHDNKSSNIFQKASTRRPFFFYVYFVFASTDRSHSKKTPSS